MTGYWRSFSFLILLSVSACQTAPAPQFNDTIEVYEKFSDLQGTLDKEREKVLVVNFWATSCPPCLKEMPHFNELEKEYADKNVKIILVSLDRARDLNSRVYPFVEKLEIKPEVVLLEDQNYSKWTEKIDASWYGALPATVIINGEKRKFRFGAYETYSELQEDIKELGSL